jgi:hypothetical protein
MKRCIEGKMPGMVLVEPRWQNANISNADAVSAA